MEIRVLTYFIAVAKHESFSKAATTLFITQPTLSRQILDLEKELGVTLFQRGKKYHKLTLTSEGLLLLKRAEEIVNLANKVEKEFQVNDSLINGEIYIGGGETKAMQFIAKVMNQLNKTYSQIHFHIFSGNADEISEKLEKGLLDFGLLIEPTSIEKYDYYKLPMQDTWGLLMRQDAILSSKKEIAVDEIKDLPLIVSRQSYALNQFSGWGNNNFSPLNIVATYNLLYNASLLVEENLGYALCIDKIIPTNSESVFKFVPLHPPLFASLYVVWKKNQTFSKACNLFLNLLKQEIQKIKE